MQEEETILPPLLLRKLLEVTAQRAAGEAADKLDNSLCVAFFRDCRADPNQITKCF